MSSYLSPKVRVSQSKTSGRGLLAVEKLFKDEIIADYSNGLGKFINTEESDVLYNAGNDHMIQVDDDLFFAATSENEFEDADFLNHSCSPNAGIVGSLKVVAMRDIEPGDEITFDYAMSESSRYEIKCKCGSLICRRVITGNDWQIKELQKRYSGYFSDYLKKKIDS